MFEKENLDDVFGGEFQFEDTAKETQNDIDGSGKIQVTIEDKGITSYSEEGMTGETIDRYEKIAQQFSAIHSMSEGKKPETDTKSYSSYASQEDDDDEEEYFSPYQHLENEGESDEEEYIPSIYQNAEAEADDEPLREPVWGDEIIPEHNEAEGEATSKDEAEADEKGKYIEQKILDEFEDMRNKIELELRDLNIDERIRNSTRVLIDDLEYVKNVVKKDRENEIQYGELKRQRKAPDLSRKPKIKYAAAIIKKDSNHLIWKFFLLLGSILGIVFGFLTNSYHNFSPDQSTLSCFFYSILGEELAGTTAPFTFLPLDIGIFVSVFFTTFIIVGIIGFFAWSTAEEQKRSRVGREHGSAHLATPTDHSKFIKTFMEE